MLIQELAAKPKPVEEDNKKRSKMKPKQQKVKKNPKNRDFDGIDDDDALLEVAMASAGNCAYGTCSVSVRVMGFQCASCKRYFCSVHKYPESHGCR